MPKMTKIGKKSYTSCFSVDEESIEIIKIMAKHGPLNKNQIKDHSRHSRRVIGYRLEKYLVPQGFVRILKKTPYRNIKNAFGKNENFEITYSLDNKGFFLSLSFLKIKDNFYLKYYVEQYPKKTRETLYKYIESQHDLLYKYFSYVGLILNNVKYFDLFIRNFLHSSTMSLEIDENETEVNDAWKFESEIFNFRSEYGLYSLEDSKLNWMWLNWPKIGGVYPKKLFQIIKEKEKQEKEILKSATGFEIKT